MANPKPTAAALRAVKILDDARYNPEHYHETTYAQIIDTEADLPELEAVVEAVRRVQECLVVQPCCDYEPSPWKMVCHVRDGLPEMKDLDVAIANLDRKRSER